MEPNSLCARDSCAEGGEEPARMAACYVESGTGPARRVRAPGPSRMNPRCALFTSLLAALCVGPAGGVPLRASAASAASGANDVPPPKEALPTHWFGPGPLHKTWLGPGEDDFVELAARRGALVQLEDYGSFRLATVDEAAFGGRAALLATGADFRDELDLMVFNGQRLHARDPGALLEALAPHERFARAGDGALPPDAGLYVVQFDGPVRDAWLQRLAALGPSFRQPVPANAYVVQLAGPSVRRLERLAEDPSCHIQYAGVYEPGLRLHAELRRLLAAGHDLPQRVTVQLVDTDGVRAALAEVEALADEVYQAFEVGPYVNVQALLHPVHFQTLTAHPRVFQLEPLGVRARSDEVQGQLVAGNTVGGVPVAPGYLDWLRSRGFDAGQFATFAVHVVDDAYSLTGHPDLPASRVLFEHNPTAQSGPQGGHGFFNAHVLAGYGHDLGHAYLDPAGYRYGLGVAPWSQVGCTAIFGPAAASPTSWEEVAYLRGARVSANPWNLATLFGGAVPDYDASAQEYDYLVRDARPSTPGNQELAVVFSASNHGPGPNTVSSPATAKNVLTVGASESVRPTRTDGCGVAGPEADDANDLVAFSGRGPVDAAGGDGRWKPELVAPGTHVQAGVPQAGTTGAGLCDFYWPAGQTLYGWSSGTSHSCAAVAGGAALVHQWFLNQGLAAPSPAMVKAVLAGTAEYVTGGGANDTLPSNAQGMGRVHLSRALGDVASVRRDQGVVLTASGDSHTVTGTVADAAHAFRVALVWTDAPGATSGAPWVNDLDLTVTAGGATYRGNVFSGAFSTTGGASDTRNNVELVSLPAGLSGPFAVTVTAASIGGDGVPGNADATDQDYAIFVHNGEAGPVAPTAGFFGMPTSGDAPLAVQFTDTSFGGPTSWSWSFGDGGTSTEQHPTHTYASPGLYTVSLSMSTPGGGDTATLTDYVEVQAPPAPGIADGSFESQPVGTAPGGPWSTTGGSHLVNPVGGAGADAGMPTDGAHWVELSALDTDGATPPSSPGGVTAPSSGGAGVSQSFRYAEGETELSFDAAFLRNEVANSIHNDWMSVEVLDGVTTVCLYYADTGTPVVGTSSTHGLPVTEVTHVTADLASLFPSSTPSTVFTLRALVGNGTDGVQPSLGYVDDFALGVAPVHPVADFQGAPTTGVSPLSVQFADTSTGDVASWSWTFGDGATSTKQHPRHTYASGGAYEVSLTVSGPAGTDTLTRADFVTVSEPPAGPRVYVSFQTSTVVPGVGIVHGETSSPTTRRRGPGASSSTAPTSGSRRRTSTRFTSARRARSSSRSSPRPSRSRA